MLIRALLLAGVVLGMMVAFRVWRRPPRLPRLDLDELGVEGAAIVQFTTPWCGPCKAAAPQLRRVAQEHGLAYAEIDVADRPEIARRYGIRRVPTIAVATRAGRVLATWTELPHAGALLDAARAAA